MVDVPSPWSAFDAAGGIAGLPPGGLVTRPVRRGPLRRVRYEALLWLSDGPVDAPAAAYPVPAGLLPVLLHDRYGPREWWRDEDHVEPERCSDPGDHDARTVLREYWDAVVPDPEEGEEGAELIAPFGRAWPGAARSGTPTAEPGAAADAVAGGLLARGWLGDGPRLALAPAGRGADLPAAIGWRGPVHHEGDTARICAVLRSWEDRFGARVLALGFDRLDLSVAAPPRTLAEALPVAAEHFAFCPDNVRQGSGTVRAYAAQALVGTAHWSFWWD
ncbi:MULTISPECIES: DUF4253 domain-containing protein [Streptomyces]|uniref:DUF4253 domain-containing protein n=1 Tax=Streptomyces TaxID=1883 RepID=UPI000F6C07A5|nr:DUF4253 domain-containing protein [Streptomyces sp. W1SF4]AZM89255.1 DUF4253 domain-containing protein [Streptomyces sp. W1SF4]